MKIEHIAFDVQDPQAVAEWYVRHLGMKIVRKGPPPGCGRFLAPAEGDGDSMIEVYNNPKVRPPDYRKIDPLVLHLAFVSIDVEGDRARLLAAGATSEGEIVYGNGDVIASLRDPWGLPIQLARRGTAMTT